MVRDSVLRSKKWDKKIDADIVKQRFSALKSVMHEQINNYFANISDFESRVKKILEEKGISVTQIPFYLAYAREIFSLMFYSFTSETLKNEELAIRQKWVSRGLDNDTLMQISKLLGIEPKPLPAPIELFKIINDFETAEDLNKVHITVPENVTYYLSDEKVFNGNKSLKFNISYYTEQGYELDLKYDNYIGIIFDIDLHKFKTLWIHFTTNYGFKIILSARGLDKNNNEVFYTDFKGVPSEIDGFWVSTYIKREEVQNWDLTKRVEIIITGRYRGDIYLDLILAQIV